MMYRRIPIRPIQIALYGVSKSIVKCRTNLLYIQRYQSSKIIDSNTNVNDQKLQDIIETTNFGTEALERRRREVEENKKKDEKNKQHNKADDSASAEQPVNINIDNDEINVNVIPNNTVFPTSTIGSNENNGVRKSINEAIHKEIRGLPSEKEERRSELSKRVETFLDSMQQTIFTATKTLNDVTGYSAIDKLKNSIDVLEKELSNAREKVKENKFAYSEAIQRRSGSQREVNELLTRKHNWSSSDLERFTELYRNDHANEQYETESEQKLSEAEKKAEAIQLKLTQMILTRYHEEQIWSDKIRRASTWGTWVLMGINVFLFIIATFFVEPWKRKRLVAAFENKVKELLNALPEADKTAVAPIIEEIAAVTAGLDDSSTLEPIVETTETTQTTQTVGATSPTTVKPNLVFFGTTWSSIKQNIANTYTLLTSSEFQTISLDKLEFQIFSGIIVLIGCLIGSAGTIYFK
ncbi:Mdm33 family-domain-containing protein [Scheffersomyces amazonensis]|uniref:Mdm33 family-domain-containing protein n=1 Tax=Scheffersomyces amazonensis TaxID=1078765 RepID=UPI00315D077D